MLSKIKNWLKSYRATPFVLFILTFLSYGLFITAAGYIMDDWYIVWFGHAFGAAQYPAYFSSDRPLMGYFYTVVSTLLGGAEKPIIWNLFSLLMRWLCTCALWGMLNTLWPNAKRQNTWVALLAAVFPGYTMYSLFVVYSFFYVCLAGFFFSITLLIKAIQEPKHFWPYYLLSFIITAYSIAASEFFFGLELVRIIILWIVVARQYSGFWLRVWKTFKYWSLYFLFFIGFAIWRTFFYSSAYHEFTLLDQLKTQKVHFFISTLQTIYQSAVEAVVNSWTATVNLGNYPRSGAMSFAVLILIIIVFIGLLIWIKYSQNKDQEGSDEGSKQWGREAFWVGSFSLIFAVIPFWTANLSVNLDYPNNRFMLAYIFGSCLWIVSILELLSDKISRKAVIVIILAACATGYQFTQGLHFRNIWNQQVSLFWQLNWRMPGLEPQTTITAGSFPNRNYYSENAVTAQLNWTYADDVSVDRQIPYEFVFLNSTESPVFQNLTADTDYSVDFRTYKFFGNTSKSVLISYDGKNCLRVLDAKLTPPQGIMDDYTNRILEAANLSDLSLILPEGSTGNHPPIQVLGPEPSHTWCYYFEKADLARQNKEYSQTILFLENAKKEGLLPENESEYLPFIDAYLHQINYDEAVNLSNKVVDTNNSIYKYGLCNTWSNYLNEVEDSSEIQIIKSSMQSMGCQ